MSQKKGQLRRLGFVEDYTKLSVDKASGLYVSAKTSLLPVFVKVRLEKAEQIASEYATPTYNRLVSSSKGLLSYADGKVDIAVNASSQTLNATLQDVKNVAEPEVLKSHINSAKSAVSTRTNEAADFLKAHGLIGASRYLVSESLTTTKKIIDYGVSQSKRLLASAQHTSKDVVNSAFATGQQVVDVATKKSREAHDAVVKQPLYKNAYERTNTFVTAAQDTKVYKVTIDRIYPLVAPVYNPAYEKIEPYYTSTVNYWKPVTAAA